MTMAADSVVNRTPINALITQMFADKMAEFIVRPMIVPSDISYLIHNPIIFKNWQKDTCLLLASVPFF